ncbi:MAG: DUF3526 domain-containing protein, partial [Ferruginibacter sp.]|nr:DUF3526 domain-containing protein [Cytophagales bacterium]
WFWYYAMQQMGDDESAKQAGELRLKLQQRETTSRDIAQFIPTIHTQIQLNEIARSGFGNQLRFLDNTSKFHEKTRLYFYPKIFDNSPVNSENWGNFKVEMFSDNSSVDYLKAFIPFLLFIFLFVWLGWVNFRRGYQL